MTFPQATQRNNTSTAYKITIVELPWGDSDEYELEVHRVANDVTNSTYLLKRGQGNQAGKIDVFKFELMGISN